MVSFRSSILALAGVALFTGLASAQIINGPITGSTSGGLSCTTNVGNPTGVRQEGWAELLGDIVLTCTGGTAPAVGGMISQVNVTVALNNMNVTSRVFSNGLSEALLLIDEPGANLVTGPGTGLPQTLGVNGAPVYVNNVVVPGYPATLAGVTAVGGTTVPNVYQGTVVGNQVVFNGIPVLAPVTGGYARQFRITNIRGNASQFANNSGGFQSQTPIQASVTVTNGVPLTQSVQVIAYLNKGLGDTVVRNANNDGNGSSAIGQLQCNTAGLTAGSVLRFPEGFAAAFKTRVSPTSAYSGASTIPGNTQTSTSFTQNNPSAIYAGSESGFITTITSGGTAGLANFGTRLKAVFNNVPAGAFIYVSTTNLPAGTNVPASANTQTQVNAVQNLTLAGSNLVAGLVLSETSGVTSLGSFLPLLGASNTTSGGTSLFGPLPVDASGTATAVWEILSANAFGQETAEFAVYYTYANSPAVSPAGTVSMSFAPTYSLLNGGTEIPRFTPSSTSTSLISFALCKTVLLYPFVSAEPGLDTGIAIANTSSDPYSTRKQSGTCVLNFYGANQGTTNTFTTPSIDAGTVYSDQTSNMKSGFKGYVIAECNFQLAHGYALLSDTGIRNFATGYLALVLPRGTNNRNSQNLNYSPTNVTEGLAN